MAASSRPPERYHPGMCTATEWGQRYGKNLDPQYFDDPNHEWHLAKSKNWGSWSCCGGEVASPGCARRPLAVTTTTCRSATAEAASVPVAEGCVSGVGGRIQFLINERAVALVVGEDAKTWKLESGRVAKKKTEGTSWVWLE